MIWIISESYYRKLEVFFKAYNTAIAQSLKM